MGDTEAIVVQSVSVLVRMCTFVRVEVMWGARGGVATRSGMIGYNQ